MKLNPLSAWVETFHKENFYTERFGYFSVHYFNNCTEKFRFPRAVFQTGLLEILQYGYTCLFTKDLLD